MSSAGMYASAIAFFPLYRWHSFRAKHQKDNLNKMEVQYGSELGFNIIVNNTQLKIIKL